MTVSSEPRGSAASSEARRAGRELVLEVVFRPLSNALVPVFRTFGVSPPAIVLANAVTGLVAASAIGVDALVVGALLLQLKTLLDNTDGQLARATERVTLAGRYLDTIADLVVNAAVFAALAHVTGQPFLALAAFVALTLVLAADYNATELYRAAQGTPTPQPPPTGSRAERALASVYAVLFAPLDRAARAFAARRVDGRSAYDRVTVTVLANLGLSTQLVVLGICLALGAPSAYLWFVLACLVALAVLQIRAERQARQTAPRSVTR